jgi:hypothetical protein
MYCVPRALYCIGPACREMICALCLAVERAAGRRETGGAVAW